MLEEIEPHLAAVRQWIDSARQIAGVELELSPSERKQLLTVNRSIEQLTKLEIAVPDELRTLKLRLSAKDKRIIPADELAKRVAEVEDLLERLKVLSQAARNLRSRLRIDDPPTGRKRHNYGITLLELLNVKLLSPEDQLELQRNSESPKYEGKICPDGSIMARTDAGWRQFNSLASAAHACGYDGTKGWQYWRVIRTNGSRIPLKDIRSQYIEKGGES